jgi:hypothetical protein
MSDADSVKAPPPFWTRCLRLAAGLGYAASWLLTRTLAWAIIGLVVCHIPAATYYLIWMGLTLAKLQPSLPSWQLLDAFAPAVVYGGLILGGLWGFGSGLRQLIAETRRALFFSEVRDMARDLSQR